MPANSLDVALATGPEVQLVSCAAAPVATGAGLTATTLIDDAERLLTIYAASRVSQDGRLRRIETWLRSTKNVA